MEKIQNLGKKYTFGEKPLIKKLFKHQKTSSAKRNAKITERMKTKGKHHKREKNWCRTKIRAKPQTFPQRHIQIEKAKKTFSAKRVWTPTSRLKPHTWLPDVRTYKHSWTPANSGQNHSHVTNIQTLSCGTWRENFIEKSENCFWHTQHPQKRSW